MLRSEQQRTPARRCSLPTDALPLAHVHVPGPCAGGSGRRPRALDFASAAQILWRLPKDDVQAARLAAKVFDEASRQQLESARAIITLTCLGEWSAAGPCLARFPRLRELTLKCRLSGCCDGPMVQQQLIAATGAATGLQLAYLERTVIKGSGWPAADSPVAGMAAAVEGFLRRAPRAAAAVSLYCWGGLPPMLAHVRPLAPSLAELTLEVRDSQDLCGAAAALIASSMPALKSLSLSVPGGGRFETQIPAEFLAALPIARLTSLALPGIPWAWHSLPLAATPWSALLELRGVSLTQSDAVLAAVATPKLRSLTAAMAGSWPRREELPVFPALERVELIPHHHIGQAFNDSGVALADMAPQLARLVLTSEWELAIKCNLAWATRLTRLEIGGACSKGVYRVVHPCVWEELATAALPALRELSVC